MKIKDEILKATNQQLATITPEVGREIVKRSGVLILEGWDIYSSMVFDELRRRHDIDLDAMDPEQREKELTGVIFDDHLD